jgi:hypothetical protein
MALQGDETRFYNVMEVFIMAWGDHGEKFNWAMDMYDGTYGG